jgi:hypothetical protein
MLLSTPITRFSPRAAIRLKGRVFFMATRIPEARASGYAPGSLTQQDGA